MIWPDHHKSTHPPTHPWNYTPTHGWGSLHRFQIFKRNWNILISSSAIEFWLIPQVSPGGWGDGWMGWGVVTGSPPHMCTHMHVHVHTYDIIGNPWDFPKSNGGGHLHGIIMFTTHTRVCMCVHMCVCVCVCAHVWGAPPNHPHPPSPPTPSATGSSKHQNSISLELIEIIRFCLKILYLWTFLNSYRL